MAALRVVLMVFWMADSKVEMKVAQLVASKDDKSVDL